jgi:hemolysin activation/secretion protein
LFTVNLGLIGQFTNDSLPISQRCGTKTNEYTRGFDQGYVNGDRCWGGRVELAYNVMPPKPMSNGGLAFTQAYFGIDGGQVEDVPNAILPGTIDNWSSASLGVRTLYGDFIFEASLTRILDKPVGVIDQKDARLWVRGTVRF